MAVSAQRRHVCQRIASPAVILPHGDRLAAGKSFSSASTHAYVTDAGRRDEASLRTSLADGLAEKACEQVRKRVNRTVGPANKLSDVILATLRLHLELLTSFNQKLCCAQVQDHRF